MPDILLSVLLALLSLAMTYAGVRLASRPSSNGADSGRHKGLFIGLGAVALALAVAQGYQSWRAGERLAEQQQRIAALERELGQGTSGGNVPGVLSQAALVRRPAPGDPHPLPAEPAQQEERRKRAETGRAAAVARFAQKRHEDALARFVEQGEKLVQASLVEGADCDAIGRDVDGWVTTVNVYLETRSATDAARFRSDAGLALNSSGRCLLQRDHTSRRLQRLTDLLAEARQ